MVPNMPKPFKQLGELLQEQQEPFTLEVYLLERGYLKKRLNEENSFVTSHRNSKITLKKNRNSFVHCPKILRAVCNKLVSSNQNQRRSKCCDPKDGNFSVTEVKRKRQEVAELDIFSTESSTTISDSDIEETQTSLHKDRQVLSIADHNSLREKEVDTDGNLQRMREESSKQLSPVSVLLEELPSKEGQLESRTRRNRGFSISTFNLEKKVKELSESSAQRISKIRQEENASTSNCISRKKITEDSILSASLWELLIHSTSTEEVSERGPHFYYLNSKRVLQQRKQLLFDCVREAIERHEKRQRIQGTLPTFLGPEELGKLICERIMTWSKQSGNETNINRLLGLDLLDSAEEWNELEPGVGELAKEIGDAIFEDLIDEIIG